MYIQIDEKNRVTAARQEAGEGWLWCEEMTGDRVLTDMGAPRYAYLEGRLCLRTRQALAHDEAEMGREDALLLHELAAPLTNQQRIEALEEELKAARILLGLEA